MELGSGGGLHQGAGKESGGGGKVCGVGLGYEPFEKRNFHTFIFSRNFHYFHTFIVTVVILSRKSRTLSWVLGGLHQDAGVVSLVGGWGRLRACGWRSRQRQPASAG